MNAATAQDIGLLRRFDARIANWHDILDLSWRDSELGLVLDAGANCAPPARHRLHAAAFQRWCGPWPNIAALRMPAGGLATFERPALLARLCALALLLRPGVIRCCIDRRARSMLSTAVGAPAFEALRQAGAAGRAVTPDIAHRTPLDWACIGYFDLTAAGLWPDRSLRRLVRLALPRQLPRAQRARPGPSPGGLASNEALMKACQLLEAN